MSPEDALRTAFDRIEQWMRSHDASVLVDNLAPGASEERLRETEARLGFPVGVELRAMWSIHDGQRDELNGFVEAFDLLSSELAVVDRDTVTIPLEYLREDPGDSDLTDAELRSDAWIAFARRDSDGLAICTTSGRVFEIMHDDYPPLHLVADSLVAWATAFAARVVADDYRVEEGFGDCYLVRRNRERERLDAEAEAKRAAEAARKAKLSPDERMRDAIARKNVDDAAEAVTASTIATLFAEAGDPAFIAASLRPMINELTLSSQQWAIVAEGGVRLGNNAIRDIARKKMAGS
jgi:hypothetical protein